MHIHGVTMTTLAVVATKAGPWSELAGPTGTALAAVLTVLTVVHLLGGVSIFTVRSSKRRQREYFAKLQNGQLS